MSCGAAFGCSNSPDGAAAATGGSGGSGSGGTASAAAGSDNTQAGSGSGGEEPAAPSHSYAADDPNLQYMGRIDWQNPKAPRFSSPAVQVTAKLVGTGATIKLQDQFRYGSEKNYFEVVIDDAPAVKLTPVPGQTSYEIAQGLPHGEHTITVAKRTEASIGYADFLGLDVAGELSAPPEAPTRRIEIIGDSISCGAGNEAANGSPECSEGGWGQPYHNGYRAYGPVMARALKAAYHVTAVSGIGLVRNYSSMYDARPMPAVYDLLYPQEMTSSAWDTTQFVPDVVVIALGTNDFSPGDSEREKMSVEAYTTAYVDFVTTLRGYYPEAQIIGLSSPMLGDGWPLATDTSATDLKDTLTNVVEHFAAAGDNKVHRFDVLKLSGTGCGTHPSAEQDAAMGDEVAEFVRGVMGW